MLKVCQERAEGKTVKQICEETGWSQSTVSTIWSRREKIWSQSGAGAVAHSVPARNRRNLVIEEMEPLLVSWIVSERKKGAMPEGSAMKKKGLEIYTSVGVKMLEEGRVSSLEKFTQSSSWLANFLKRNEGLFKEEEGHQVTRAIKMKKRPVVVECPKEVEGMRDMSASFSENLVSCLYIQIFSLLIYFIRFVETILDVLLSGDPPPLKPILVLRRY